MAKQRKNPLTGKPMMSEDDLRREPFFTRFVAAILAKHTFPELMTPDDVALLAAINTRLEDDPKH